jgi:hypothetical protein
MELENLKNTIKSLCTPSYIYFMLSMISILLMALQNIGNTTNYCVGMLECEVPNTPMIFFSKLLYVIFWTWALNFLCKKGLKSVSWFLVLFPILLMFTLIASVFINEI